MPTPPACRLIIPDIMILILVNEHEDRFTAYVLQQRLGPTMGGQKTIEGRINALRKAEFVIAGPSEGSRSRKLLRLSDAGRAALNSWVAMARAVTVNHSIDRSTGGSSEGQLIALGGH